MRSPKIGAVVVGLALFISTILLAETKRPITPQDCVTVRDILPVDMTASWRWPIKMSPDGHSVAYLVESPNLITNVNDIVLYVRTVQRDSSTPSRILLTGDISDFLWTSGGRSIAVLIKDDGRRVLKSIDIATGGEQILVKADKDIDEFSIDESGDTVVYTARESNADAVQGPTAQEIARGYRIPFEKSDELHWLHSSVYVTRYVHGSWLAPRMLTFTSPLSGQKMTSLALGTNLPLVPTLSPDGSRVLISYFDFSTEMPSEWRASGFKKYIDTSAGTIQAFRLLLLYDIKTGNTSVPLKTSFNFLSPLWSPDSKSFMAAAMPEVGSEEEEKALKDGSLGHHRSALLFFVEVANKQVAIIATHIAYPWEGALCANKDGSVFARVRADSVDTISRFSRQNGGWSEEESFKVPLPLIVAPIAVSEQFAIGGYSGTTIPPELFVYPFGKEKADIFEKLNPQFDQLSIAEPLEVEWKTAEGFNATGVLLLPPGYERSKRYPLVIHTKPFSNGFLCGFGNYPSFAPQPIANAGIIYLGPGSLGGKTDSEPEQKITDYTPKGFPPGMSEPAFAMSAWDSAVKALSERGMVDENRVGIIGFSRTGWYTEFILVHAKTHYRAATVADNVQYSLGEYWLAHDAGTMKSYDNVYGGPPYGATLKNWLDYSVSFNLDKIRTPLLMEEMGYGISPTVNPLAPPLGLATSYEVFSGLNRLGKPVELYYYPNEGHTPEHPQARLATMQRNLDWYRFWLQGYERQNPDDRSQYARWRMMQNTQTVTDK